MSDRFQVAIVGSGPGGLSAAARAAEAGDSHILLEAQPHCANTVFRYQRGKHVMAEPAVLPLRACARFEAGRREDVLQGWQQALQEKQVNVRYGSEVSAIQKDEGGFRLTLSDGHELLTETVVLAIGVQGNIRKLGCPGEDLPNVQYQLDDPSEYRGETIVVVGAGDAAIENAMALATSNKVHILNRREEFSRAKEANAQGIESAIDSGRITAHYSSTVDRVTVGEDGRLRVEIQSREGAATIDCDRVIARLGATPPRRFVESCGIEFANDDPQTLPQVSPTYESNVKGLYIIGALAGYPLIKQAMNQGYEVIEFIAGRPVEPADKPLLVKKFEVFSGIQDVEMVLDVIRTRSPVLRPLNRLQLRELILESELRSYAAGERIYSRGDYGSSVYVVLSGELSLVVDENEPSRNKPVVVGRIVGEMALISGRPRTGTVLAGEDSVVLEVPRRAMLKLISSNERSGRYVNRTFALRMLQRNLAPDADEKAMTDVLAKATTREYKARETIFTHGDAADRIYIVRSGSVMHTVQPEGREVVLSYTAAGQYFGELDVIAGTKRQQAAVAAIRTEVIEVPAADFLTLLEQNPTLQQTVRAQFADQIRHRVEMERSPDQGAIMHFLLQQGLGEATDALLIDEALCVRCDQCETACAATHGNVSRLDREAGATFANVHVPTSCRHCEHPHCMKECPPDAIHRSANGEVYIDETCIGCGNCERNCPYGVIQMGQESDQQTGILAWLLGGKPIVAPPVIDREKPKKAVKCDMCRDRAAGPACVQACPTGAAIRVGPEQLFKVLSRGN